MFKIIQIDKKFTWCIYFMKLYKFKYKKIQTAAAPIERIKLLVQNQAEMIKQGTLDRPYGGVVDCAKRTMASEGKFCNNLKSSFDPIFFEIFFYQTFW